ncbi:MAG: hypothetical protein MJ153_06840 [Clostridia bacterium]|nr:hypothetical protein [Clostridia bacterium]
MKRKCKNIIIETIVLGMLMGMTSCDNSAADSKMTESIETSTVETETEVDSTPTTPETETEATSETSTSEVDESGNSDDFHLYTDWDNYYSGKEDKDSLPESKYKRLSPELIDHYEAGTANGYIYPFRQCGGGATVGFVDESGTIVCDGVYTNAYSVENFDVNCWVAEKYTVVKYWEYDDAWYKYTLIAYDGSFVLDNNGEGYDCYCIVEDYIYCASFDDDGVSYVDIFDFEGNNLLHSEFQSPLRQLYEEECELKGYEGDFKKYEYINQFVSLINEHYVVYSCHSFTYTMDLLTGEVINTSDLSSFAWAYPFSFSKGYVCICDDGGMRTTELYDETGKLRAVIEGFDNAVDVAPDRFWFSNYDEGIGQIVDIDGNVIIELMNGSYYPEHGIISDGHLYSFDGEDLGDGYDDSDILEYYEEEWGDYYYCYLEDTTIKVIRDHELDRQIPEGLCDIPYPYGVNFDCWAGSHTILIRDYYNSMYYMFDMDTDEILFVYRCYEDEEARAEYYSDYEDDYEEDY